MMLKKHKTFYKQYIFVVIACVITMFIATESSFAEQVLKVGLIKGTGEWDGNEDVAFERADVEYEEIGAGDYTLGNLMQFDVIGIDAVAYDTNTNLQSNYNVIKQYIEKGGYLVFLDYQQDSTWDEDYLPYPLTLYDDDIINSREVTLADHPLFVFPNEITAEEHFADGLWGANRYFADGAHEADSPWEVLVEDVEEGWPMIVGAEYGRGYVVFSALRTLESLSDTDNPEIVEFLQNLLFWRQNMAPPGYASKPSPGNGATEVLRDADLSWLPGEYPGTHNVYFSADFNDVNDSTALVSEEQDANTYEPGFLEFGTTYYWRIDEVNDSADATVYRGNIWSFTTEAYSLKVPSDGISVKASSQESEEDAPINAINESGLDPNYMDLHSDDTKAMWSTDDANSADPAWIQFDFDKVYKLDKMLVWNYNGQSLLAGFGIKDVNIQYSEDGQSWNQLTSATQFAKATGKPNYEYNTTVDFNGLSVKAVKINAVNNWGGPWYPQYGLSEVRFMYIPVRAREPYPDDMNDIPVDVTLTWRAGRDSVEHTVSYSTDEQAVLDGTAASTTVSQTSYGPLSLDLGSNYYWRVDSVGTSDTWTGDIWSFRTEQYIIVEDFESYDDDEPNRIWDAWADGWDDDNNGSTIGYPDPDFDNDEHFVEVTVVHNGGQSGPVLYDNTAPVNYSEALLVLEAAQDWTSNGADEVVMSFRGNAVTFQETDDGYIAMSAEGADIYGTEDEFRYAYKTLQGNGSITVRVDSIEAANVWSKAGIMIRNSLDANDIHVTAILAANDIAEFESRSEMGGNTANTDVADFGAPCWLRITRTGDDFTAECSKDGLEWQSFEEDANEATTINIDMGNTVYIGLAVTSHEPDVLAAATFYGVETTGNVSGDWTVVAIGDEEQAEGGNTLDKLYIALEDSSGNRHDVFAPTLAAAGWGNWYEWIIPQSEYSDNGVNMSRIKKIFVGLGDPSDPMNGSGMIFIDDIGYGHTVVEE